MPNLVGISRIRPEFLAGSGRKRPDAGQNRKSAKHAKYNPVGVLLFMVYNFVGADGVAAEISWVNMKVEWSEQMIAAWWLFSYNRDEATSESLESLLLWAFNPWG